jgi:aminopeptidase
MKKQNQIYQPPKNILENYAKVLVNFALNSGKGIKKDETVMVYAGEISKPLFAEIVKTIWKSGGHVISGYAPDDEPNFKYSKEFFTIAKEHQITNFPRKYYRGLVDEIDHSIFIDYETDLKSMQGVDSKKIMKRGQALKEYKEWRNEKENAGKFTWTLALYGTPAMAKEAGLSQKEYWNQIINACFLNSKNPIAKWKEVYKQIENYIKKLNNLKIEKVHVVGSDVDLWIKIGDKRKWVGGSGRNIPSFEIFTSPDWRGTDGWIRFNQPLYRYGNIIEGIELEFKNGVVVKSKAKKNEKILKDMIATSNANKVGEFSLTDSRFSRITKFMATTLFDENMGGKFGNTHIALGDSYHDCFDGNPTKMKSKDWEKLGFNNSSVHTDIISTTDRTVTATLKNGKEIVIYKNGKFVI